MNDTNPHTAIKLIGSPGVHFLGKNALQLQTHASTLGYTFIAVDMAGNRDKEDVLTRIADTLQFPDWFGHNWDALCDCLTDMSWNPASGYFIVLNHLDELRQYSPFDYSTLLDVLRDVVCSQLTHNVPTWFFIGLDNLDDISLERP